MSTRKPASGSSTPAEKPAAKAAKPAAKNTAKPAAKNVAKPAAKAPTKAAARPAAKAAAKPAPKPAPKAGAKPKPAAKPKATALPSVPRSPDAYRPIATGGQGHPGAARAQAMAWFQDRLFTGTANFTPKGEDDRARILAHDPATGTWETAFESPLADLKGRQQAQMARLDPAREGGRRLTQQTGAVRMAHDFGVTAMAVFQGASDPAPCLYCGTASIGGGLVLRSEDGATFDPVSLPGIDDDSQMSIGALAVAGTRLFAAPMGTLTTQEATRHVAPASRLYYSDDPASGDWHRITPPGFDGTGNTGVTALAVAHDHLYAGISNPLSGYQIWRLPLAEATGDTLAEAPWQQMLQNGAWRFNHNLAPVALTAFGAALYIGSGLPGMGYDEAHDVGPAACELVRLNADGSWDLLMGEPRFTPDGLKVPFSAKGPGFGDPCNSAVQSLAVQGDTLFVGIANWRSLDWAMGDGQGALTGGFQLWASTDGDTWEQVLRDGHGQPGATGLPSLCATPAGLYLGSANQGAAIQAEAARHKGGGLAVLDVSAGFDVLLAAPQG